MQRSKASSRRRRTQQGDSVEKRADRTMDLVQMGELSAARHALEGDPIAPGNRQTLYALQDPVEQDRFSVRTSRGSRGPVRHDSGPHQWCWSRNEIALLFACVKSSRGATSGRDSPGCEDRQDDGVAEATGRGARYCGRRFHASGGGAHPRTAAGSGSGATHITFPVRILNEIWASRPHRDLVVSRRNRSVRRDSWRLMGGFGFAFGATILQHPVTVLVDR